MPQVKFQDIYIPEPCNEEWGKMKSFNGCNKFCASCEKDVIDFTQLNESQLNKIIDENGENVCGRFSDNQISQHLAYQVPLTNKKKISVFTKSIIASLATFFAISLKSFGQEIKFNKNNIFHYPIVKSSKSKIGVPQQINGQIYNQHGDKINLKVLVKIYIDNQFISSVYSSEGKFNYKFKKYHQGKELKLVIDKQRFKRKRFDMKFIKKIDKESFIYDFKSVNNPILNVNYDRKRRKMITYHFRKHWMGCPKFR